MASPVLLVMILWLPGLAGQNDTNCTDDVCLTEECISLDDVCMTEECISLAHEMITSMDESTDPCHNFYQYACGGWIQNQFLPPDTSSRTHHASGHPFISVRKILARGPKPTDLNAVKKAKNMYQSCVDYAKGTIHDTDIIDVVNATFGGWPLTCDNCTADEFDLETFLFKAIQLGVHPLFTLVAPSHPEARLVKYKRGQRYLVVSIPKLWLRVLQYIRLSRKHSFRHTYKHTIYNAAKHFGIENHTKAMKDAEEIENVETALVNMHFQFGYGPAFIDLATLDNNYGKLLNWTSLVSRFESFQNTSGNLSINVRHTEYLRNMVEYFSQLPPRTQANYIIWRVIDSLQSVLLHENTKLKTIALQYVTGVYRVPLPEKSCAEYVSKVFHLAVHRMLYNEHLPWNKLNTLNQMIRSLRQEFDALLDEHVLLNLTDLEIMREKNNAIEIVLEFHIHAMNDSFLENYYSNVTIDSRNFIKNVIAKRKDTFDKEFSFPLNYHNFEVAESPHRFDAHYSHRSNILEFNAALVQPPLWIDNVPASINFARFGEVIGHELIHGAVTGHKFDKHGNEGDWWYDETDAYFNDRYQCLVDQYSNFFYTPANQYVDGNLTLQENISDNTGLKMAYKAYINYTKSGVVEELKMPGLNLSHEQIFFLAFAQMQCTVGTRKFALDMIKDPHSPFEFRVNGTLQNSQAFANAFNCPVGSRMNPSKKCDVW